MRKVLSFTMAVIMIISVCTVFVYAEDYPQMQVEVRAKSALLMEASTGRVLMAQNADERLYPASVTKIMSMLLVVEALENGKIQLTDVVTASANASKKGGSQIWLKDGEQMTVDELLKATAVASANDACTALGEYIAGSDDAFVKLMNDRAKQLGMNNTNFDNCTGLDDTTDSHYTTAYDIALMSRELLKHDLIRNYSTVWMDTLRNGETQLVNTNKLIKSYDGATGLKTGTTSKAGCCVSASAERDGLELIAVVMGSDNSNDRFNSARAMLDWGFANYSAVTLSTDASLITDVNVINGVCEKITPVIRDESTVVVQKGREGDITQSVELAVDVEAPVEENQVLGSVSFILDGERIAEYKLYSPQAVEKLSFFERYKRMLSRLL